MATDSSTFQTLDRVECLYLYMAVLRRDLRQWSICSSPKLSKPLSPFTDEMLPPKGISTMTKGYNPDGATSWAHPPSHDAQGNPNGGDEGSDNDDKEGDGSSGDHGSDDPRAR